LAGRELAALQALVDPVVLVLKALLDLVGADLSVGQVAPAAVTVICSP
jgi:hypothetical protein